MWIRRPPGSVDSWRRMAAHQTAVMNVRIDEYRRAGAAPREIGEAVASCIEDIDCASVYIDLITGAGSFDDPAWIERRHKEALARLDEETDETLLPGLRKIAKAWFEEKAYMRMKRRARALGEVWDWEGAKALYEGFAAWMIDRHGVPWQMPEDRRFPWGGMAHLRRIDPEEWRKAGEA
jgi:hypothetical protein